METDDSLACKKDDSESGKVWLRLSQRRASPGTAIQCDAGVTSTRDEIHVDMAMDGILTSPSKRFDPFALPRMERLLQERSESWWSLEIGN